jgi:tRNA pseudouridine32 synthase/23S rRNA pseudouridine746 synthase
MVGSPFPVMAAPPMLRVVCETHGVLAIYKPAGLSFHSEGDSPGVMPLVRAMQASGAIGYGGRLRAVHRLDRPTSGLLLLAKTSEAADVLSGALRERSLAKYYVALSDRKPLRRQGRVRGEMVKARRGSWRLTRSLDNSPSLTHFTSEPLPTLLPDPLHAFLLRPVTGQTHQLRVALKSLAAPVLGDERYAHAPTARQSDRAYLHAAAIRLPRREGWAPEPALCANGEPLDIVCAPAEGILFSKAGFQQWWGRTLGGCGCGLAGVRGEEEAEVGTWFEGTTVESRCVQLRRRTQSRSPMEDRAELTSSQHEELGGEEGEGGE